MKRDTADDARERRAFELRKEHYVELAAFATWWGCTIHEAQQVANESLADLASREFGDCPPVQNARAWLYKVALNKARAAFSSRPQHVQLEDVPTLRLVDSSTLGPEEYVEWIEVLDAVARLPEVHRLPLALTIRQDISIAQIADILGCSTQAARQRICRARKALREILGMEPTEGRAG